MKQSKKQRKKSRQYWGTLGLVSMAAIASHLVKEDSFYVPTQVQEPFVNKKPVPVETLYDRLTEDEKTFLAKILYFETYDLPGAEAAAHVIRNRYLFDTCHPLSPLENFTCYDEPKAYFGGDKGLIGVVTKGNKGIHQFSCIDQNPTYFRGKLDTNVQGLNSARLEKAHTALEGVLNNAIEDPTGGALFYKNSEISGQRWQDKIAFAASIKECDSLTQPLNDAQGNSLLLDDHARCLVDIVYKKDHSAYIEGHDFYTIRPMRKETVYKNGCKFVNGVFTEKGSKLKYCPSFKKYPDTTSFKK